MKKRAGIGFVAMAATMAVASGAWALPQLSVQGCAVASGSDGQEVCVDVTLATDGARVANADLVLTFDTTVLSLPPLFCRGGTAPAGTSCTKATEASVCTGNGRCVDPGTKVTRGAILNTGGTQVFRADASATGTTGQLQIGVFPNPAIDPVPLLGSGQLARVCFAIQAGAAAGCNPVTFVAQRTGLGDDAGFDIAIAPSADGGVGVAGQLDHFMCYKSGAAKAPKGVPPFPAFSVQSGVTVVDAFSTTAAGDQSKVDLPKAVTLCNPADKNGETPDAPNHPGHLEGYQTKLTKTDPKQPKFVARTQAITDQFGDLVLSAKNPDRLLVPTAKAEGTTPPAALANSSLDHFRCYKATVAKAPKGQAPYPEFTPRQVTVKDQFGGPVTYDLKKVTRLCNPANKNGEDADAPGKTERLVCYQTALAKLDPAQAKFVKRQVSTTNQFGSEVLDAKTIEELCVPAEAKPLP